MRPDALLEDAAGGRLPDWVDVSDSRREHMERVSALMGQWAAALQLSKPDQVRWRAAGMLHDALRETPPEQLRPLVPEPLRDLVGKLLHGPAAAVRLREQGLADEPVLRAIAYHTIGHPELDDLGRALFIADYIEPGRSRDPETLAELRGRMPANREDVLIHVLGRRLKRVIDDGRPIRPETATFWNVVTGSRDG